jgi:hypothetical protein
VTNDFYNFDLGTSLADESIYITLDTDQVNAVTAVYAGRHLQVLPLAASSTCRIHH